MDIHADALRIVRESDIASADSVHERLAVRQRLAMCRAEHVTGVPAHVIEFVMLLGAMAKAEEEGR